MICKKDVALWFQELESYRRIDTMCTLLNMCLPFELRFLGTCLEELGRRDSQELRGMELRANNPQDLAADMVACQKGEPTDKKIRRKMALYLALIRACNRTCVTEIFRTLDGWGDRDFQNVTDSDTLQELLLVYTMAANHPVFCFEQQSKFLEIFEKIKQNKLVSDSTSTPLQYQQQHQQHMDQSMAPGQQQQQHQQDIRQHLPPSHQEILQQHALHAMHLSGQHPQLLASAPIHLLPQGSMNFSQQQMTNQIPVDHSIPHMISSNITIPADSSTILTHPGGPWSERPYMQSGPTMEHPPQSSSPMLSQQSSPSSSRATSPNRSPLTIRKRMQQQQQGVPFSQQQVRNMSQRIGAVQIKNVRRPSAETTPPPIGQQQQQQQSHQQMMSNEMILPQNIKHLDDSLMNNDGSGSQLSTLIRLNGYPRNTRIKPGSYIHQHQQQQQQQQQSPVNQHYPANFPGLTYSMQNMTMTDGGGGGGNAHLLDGGMNSNKSAGSDSGSSIGSSGETSPPETPTLLPNNSGGVLQMNCDQLQQQHQKHHQQQQQQQQMSYNKQMGLARLNGGRSEKQLLGNSAGGVGNNQVSTGSTLIYHPGLQLSDAHQSLTQQQSQQLFGTEIILAPGGNAGSANLMQTSMSNNNNGGGTVNSIATSANTVSSNNNMGTNTVLISSPSAVTGGLMGNVITSNSVILQPHQQQYNTSYPYHAVAAPHFASSSRPPLMSHNPGMAPPPPGTFRMSGFQIPHNGELIYPQYTGIAFLSGAPQLSGAPPVALRSTNSASVSSNAVTGGGVPQQSQPPQSLQSTQAAVPNAALLAASPYSTLTVGVSKPLSCYNCGSQTHSGQDCQEASMDDVTRSAIYKLDYSVSASSNASPTASTGSNVVGGSGGNSGIADTTHHHHHHHQQHQKQHMDSSAGVATSTSSTSTAASTLTPTVSAGVLNTK